MQVENQLITGGVNPIYQCVAIKNEGILYGCSNQIYVYDYFGKNKILQTLKGHKKRVNTLKFLENTEKLSFISGSSDGQIFIWENEKNSLLEQGYKTIEKIDLKGSVQFIAVREIQGFNYIVTGDSEGFVYFFKWNNKTKELIKIQQYQYPPKSVIETADLYILNVEKNDEILFALGSLDFSIHLYSMKIASENQQVVYKMSLKGHNNAITCLSFKEFYDPKTKNPYVLLASSSKYNYIRIHKVQDKKYLTEMNSYDKKTSFSIDKENQISLDSVLYGHSDTVVSLQWGLSNLKGDFKNEQDVALISASFDFSIIIWTYEDGIWFSKIRLGQMTGNKHAFFNAQFSEDFRYIFSYTYTGAFNIWYRKNEEELRFDNTFAISGNISYVTDLDWSSDFKFLVTSSQDQTTRVYSQNKETKIWHEYSRAQIHGYDINSIKMLKLRDEKNTENNYCDILICGADEKVLRLLEPPAYFINYLNNQCDNNLKLYIPNAEEEAKVLEQNILKEKGIIQYKTMTEGDLQVLGLMTKQIKIEGAEEQIQEESKKGEEEIQSKKPKKKKKSSDQLDLTYNEPPSEDFLEKHTLWPELNKLYGHGYEISCTSSDHSGERIVSACKSQTTDQSKILFFDPKTYGIIDQITFHNYTIMQLEFSHNDKFLGSVSRDRQFALFKKNSETNNYELFFNDQSHTRIIWSLCFSHDDQYVITGGRDKKIKIWQIQGEEKVTKVTNKVWKVPVTAVCFSQHQFADIDSGKQAHLVAIGFENGVIEIYKFIPGSETPLVFVNKIDEAYAHSNIIKRLKFRKNISGEPENVFELASCSSDHSMRLLKITM